MNIYGHIYMCVCVCKYICLYLFIYLYIFLYEKVLPGTYLMHKILRYYTNKFYITVFMLRLAY